MSHHHIKNLDMAGTSKQLLEVQPPPAELSMFAEIRPMFVSLPHYEFPIPDGLKQPGSQHWRMIELTLQAPWFLLSVEADTEEPDLRMTRTLCIAWDTDLVDLIRSLDATRVKGIVCMVPAWQSPTGHWASRVVREVWMCQSDAGQSVSLRDEAGESFDCGLVPAHVEPIERELMLRVPEPPKRPHRRSRASRRSAQRGVAKE